ncbi:MAG: hypothetical protein LBT46_12880 [Planctomycetaceae bacterium]|jgi:hypothetical protein|nr:hypothetical protein [Planctomycetaceae bacterium]
MDDLAKTVYEICDLFSKKRIQTESREEAIEYYEEGRLVYEHRITLNMAGIFFQSQYIVTIPWNNNPYYDPLVL